MKALIFDEWFPWPLESGKKIRSYNLVKLLAQKHDIIYLAYAKLPEDAAKIEELSSFCYRVIPVPDLRTEKWKLRYYLDVCKNIFSNKPFSTVYHITDYYKDILDETIKNENPDIVHCEWSNLAPFLENITDRPTVISAHNVESDIWKRLSGSSKNVLVKYIGKQQAERIEDLEKYWYPRVSCCIAVSKSDQEVIRGYGAHVEVIDNGVDLDYYDEWRNASGAAHTIAFTASFDTFSNQDGAFYFLREIFPLIRRADPQMQLFLIGKNPPKSLLRLANVDSGIHITGTVADVRPYLKDIALCVVPLRIGGGSRLKILEAMAMQKPVVSTPIGAEGLEVTNKINIMLEENPVKFAETVLQLVADKRKRKSIAQAGYDFVKQNYDWKYLAEKHAELWTRAVERHNLSTAI
jgi:glycosyltransferase involved in cell wall biosynthesis